MSATVLSPYRTLSSLRELSRPSIRLVFGSAGPNPGAFDLGSGEYALGTDSDWNPDLHNLTVSCILGNVSELGSLFGTGGIAAADGALLLALEWASADSGWRSLGQPLRLTVEDLPEADESLTLLLVLPEGSTRGTGVLSVQVFLGDPGRATDGDAGMARTKGVRFGTVAGPVRVVVDGDGSLFPVLEERLGQDEALWQMRVAWNDPREEPFTSEYVALVLNRDHELFEQLRERRDGQIRQSALMQHVLASWIALLVHAVSKDLESDFDEFVARPVLSDEFASIAEAAAGLVRMGDLNTSSLHALSGSAQRWLDRRVRAATTGAAK
jgi:hypothetical protein